jgi:DNA-directed RNA polymerase specialized sigma24 family protein
MTKKSRPGTPGGNRNGSSPASKSLDKLAREVFEQLQGVHPTRSALRELLKSKGLALADATRMTPEKRDAVSVALDHLPAEQRKMLMWHWGGMSSAEIARRQAKTTEDVMRELAEALARLRVANERHGDE